MGGAHNLHVGVVSGLHFDLQGSTHVVTIDVSYYFIKIMASKTGPATSRSGVPVTPAPATQHRPPSAKKKRLAEDKAESYYRVGLIGSGNLARAIVEGLLASGTF